MCNVDVFRLARNDNYLKLTKIRGIIYYNLKVKVQNNHARNGSESKLIKFISALYALPKLCDWKAKIIKTSRFGKTGNNKLSYT